MTQTAIFEENNFFGKHHQAIKEAEVILTSKIFDTIAPLNEQSETRVVEHILSRIKTKKSTEDKLRRIGAEPTGDNAVKLLQDVVGIRLIVGFISNIYVVKSLIVNCGRFRVVKEKDYISNPKPTGYRGYHIIVQEDVLGETITAEIQLRTIAMDCWASLEHQIRYKKTVCNESEIVKRLLKCSEDLLNADIEMEQIMLLSKNQNTPELEVMLPDSGLFPVQ